MNSYQSVACPKDPAKWLLWSLTFIFLTTLTTFTILEVRSLNNEQPSVIRIILNTLNFTNEEDHMAREGEQVNRFVLVDVEDIDQTQDELVEAIVSKVEEENATELERKTREVDSRNVTEVGHNNNSYYEEQTPVVVYSKTDQEAPLAYRQEPPIPYQQGSLEEQPYYNAYDNNDSGNANGDYATDEESYYHPQYDDDSREDFEGPPSYNAEQDSAEGRSAQSRQFDAYYRQWHYATPPPYPLSAASSASASKASTSASSSSPYILTASSKGNRKLPDMAAAATADSRDPYASYMDDYDYMPTHRSPAVSQQYQQQVQGYRPQTSSQAVQKQESEGSEMNFLSILKTLKTLWDLYQSFASAWNSMAEHRNKQEELAKQKYKQQQQLRINSKKPPKIISKMKPDGPARNAKNPKQTTTTLAPTNTSPMSTELRTSSSPEDALPVKAQQLQTAKVEPRKGSKGDKKARKDVDGLREKRETGDGKDASSSTDVGEGRYIKGDPLKGYYDFVITEGSYKFWAVFQVGTALLIIYSTFAAIYYSKVNPLVSDYDYTDYLGGGRSLSGGDLDFVDDEMTADNGSLSGQQKAALLSQGWFDWMPRTGHSLKFILDAIEKLPVDHEVNTGGAHNNDATEHLNESTQKKAM